MGSQNDSPVYLKCASSCLLPISFLRNPVSHCKNPEYAQSKTATVQKRKRHFLRRARLMGHAHYSCLPCGVKAKPAESRGSFMRHREHADGPGAHVGSSRPVEVPGEAVLLLETWEVGRCREDSTVCDVTAQSFYVHVPLWSFGGGFGRGCNKQRQGHGCCHWYM